jgi:hypothetical protein
MMVKQYLFILMVVSFQIVAYGQEVSYTNMDMSVLEKNANLKTESMRFVYNLNLQFLFDSFAGSNLNGRKSQKEKEEAAERIYLLKENFSSRKTFPDSITSGWHNVILTDSREFCRDAKVLVSANSIQQLVVDDCIRINCSPGGKVKNARTVLTLKDINTEYQVLEVYFNNDLDSPVLIDEPMQPGLVCFWTSKEKFLNERLMINGIRRDFISKLHDEEPECLERGVPFYILKPGKYKSRATKNGNDKEANFEVKSGMCLKYRLK